MVFGKIIALYSENYTESINAIIEQIAELLNVKVCGR